MSRRYRAALLAAIGLPLLGGCGLLPEATAQLRITEHHGGGGLTPAELRGGGCIVSEVGRLSEHLEVVYDGERCVVRYRAEPSEATRL